MSSASPKQRLLQAGRKTRDALRIIRDTVRNKLKDDLYDETFNRLDEAVELATDGLIDIANIFGEVLASSSYEQHPTSDDDMVELAALQSDLASMRAEREELITELQQAQRQLQKFADDLQVLYVQEREKRAELAIAYDKLEEADRLKTEFLTTINHELSSPLVPIDLNLQLIRKAGLNTDQEEHLDEVHELLQKYKRQLDGIIKYADLVNQPYVAAKQSFELQPVLDDALMALHLFARGRHVELDVSPLPEGFSVWADHDLLSNLIYQITHNAIKFNSPGGIVRLTVEESDGGVLITFIDNGPGIPDAVLGRFGQDFNQIVDALRRGEEGLGLGLALSNHIAAVHDGKLTAEPAEPSGTAIQLWLPGEDS